MWVVDVRCDLQAYGWVPRPRQRRKQAVTSIVSSVEQDSISLLELLMRVNIKGTLSRDGKAMSMVLVEGYT